MPHLSELGPDAIIWSYAIKVTAFDHERPRRNQRSHLGIVELGSQIELENLVLVLSKHSCN